jgi:hypothetical protein
MLHITTAGVRCEPERNNMSHYIRNFFRKRKERKDAAFLENVRNKIATADNDALIEMNQDFYHSMEADRKIGYIEPEPVVKKAYGMICEEMCKRSLKTCDEIEEDIWLSKRGDYI